MKIIIKENYDELSKEAANIFIKQINEKSNSILGLATGSTPVQTYKFLIESFKNNEISFKDIKTFNLDEYVGLDSNHIQSYRYFMNENLFNHIDIKKENTFIPSGIGNIKDNSTKYEKLLNDLGPIDLQLLGLGENAHIGFNEPGTPENSLTNQVNLTNGTIEANKRFFSSINDVPKTAISMGIGSILKSKKILLLASGNKKAEAVRNMIEGPITENVPASFLQKHKNVTIIIDKAAASLLKNKY